METMESHQPTEDSQPLLLELPSLPESGVKGESEKENQAPVRLRQPQRKQLAMVPQCVDDLVAGDHPVRMVAAVGGGLDVSEFGKEIKAREGAAGRDGTAAGLFVGLVLYACLRG